MSRYSTWTDPNGVDWKVALDDTYGGGRFPGERWYHCSVCDFCFPESLVVKFRGRIYGKPCGDYKDIASILRKGD